MSQSEGHNASALLAGSRHPSRDALVRLHEKGAKALKDAKWMASHGDWFTRAMALSAVGVLARSESPLRTFVGWLARLSPSLRNRVPCAGRRGKYVRDEIGNALVDQSWPVRFAAALALGECRSPTALPALSRSFSARYRSERIAAAAAFVACGGDPGHVPQSLASGASPAPRTIGDTTDAIAFLTTMASRHMDVLAGWQRIAGQEQPPGTTASDWATFLAGPVPKETYSGPDAEIERYDVDGETEYLLTKPFSRISRVQNVRLLHSFLVMAEQLRVPAGGRILDLGSGSGWVSELLVTLGFRVFTLDLSSALLTLGKRRFARSGLTPRLVAGDMTTLPIATGSMDAIVIVDALHHVPDVRAVFHDAFRVLAEGGQLLIAEPGEGHSESQKSRSEILEHGVEEREIHVFEVVEYGRLAGFDHIRIVPHYVPNISMSPEQLQRAMTSPVDTWTMYQEDKEGFLSSHITQSVVSRPVLAFRKGRRPIDSRSPQVLAAEIAARLRRRESYVSGIVSIRNCGNTKWIGASDQDGHVQLGLKLLDAERRPLILEFHRVRLPRDVPAGDTIEVPVDVTLPNPDEAYVLKLDLVNEGVCWFEDVGSEPAYITL